MKKDEKYWFPAKRYGWGWGLPVAWQGWVVHGVYFLLLALGSVVFQPARTPGLFVAYVLVLSALLVVVCFLKGEPPGWRWG